MLPLEKVYESFYASLGLVRGVKDVRQRDLDRLIRCVGAQLMSVVELGAMRVCAKMLMLQWF